jgi:hypothetical protein
MLTLDEPCGFYKKCGCLPLPLEDSGGILIEMIGMLTRSVALLRLKYKLFSIAPKGSLHMK